MKLGLVAALSGPSAQSGEAITRGLTVAMDEINAAGGILGGRMIELVRRDDESSPPKGVIAARELIFKEEVAAFFGGIDSPVSLAIVPLANKSKVPFMGVWAAATPITRNKADPSYVFRVSAVDAIVDIKLLQYAHATFGATKIGLMLINNPWGESNERGLVAADADNGDVEIVGIEKFENNDVDMIPQLTRNKDNGADALVLVTNAPPGAQMMKSRDRMGWDVPVVSHWGISGGRFPELAGPHRGRRPFRADLQLLRRAGRGRQAGACGPRRQVRQHQRGRRTCFRRWGPPTPTTPCTFSPGPSTRRGARTATRSGPPSSRSAGTRGSSRPTILRSAPGTTTG